MNIKNNTENQIFHGFFSYVFKDENGEGIEERVPFVMNLTCKNGSITGTTVDDESKGLFEEPITVNGFIEGKFISFIVKYPHNYDYDEDSDQFYVKFGEEYPGSEYSGEFDEAESKYVGKWLLKLSEKKSGLFQDEFEVENLIGNWEMKRRGI